VPTDRPHESYDVVIVPDTTPVPGPLAPTTAALRVTDVTRPVPASYPVTESSTFPDTADPVPAAPDNPVTLTPDAVERPAASKTVLVVRDTGAEPPVDSTTMVGANRKLYDAVRVSGNGCPPG
jgi:hypothetical protein